MFFFRQFQRFDPLKGDVPPQPFTYLPEIAYRARALLRNRTAEQIEAAAKRISEEVEGYFRDLKDCEISRLQSEFEGGDETIEKFFQRDGGTRANGRWFFKEEMEEELRAGLTVAKKASALTETYRVSRVRDGMAELVKDADDSRESAPVDSLTVVRRMGQAIHPALVPVDQVQNGDPSQPHHILIEADNYHALQLLEYLYAGKVDCIYIDPPYNTGARDWKYNNDYIDGNDGWRHSKWLTFMQKRLQLARRLLNPQTGVLIVTIDEHEVHHLGCLLEEVFPDYYRQMVTIVVNPKGVTQGRFSRVEEYAQFCFANGAYVKGLRDDLLTLDEAGSNSHKIPRWKGLLRSGTNARRQDRHKMFFPVLIDTHRKAIVGAGDFLPLNKMPDLKAKIDGLPQWGGRCKEPALPTYSLCLSLFVLHAPPLQALRQD